MTEFLRDPIWQFIGAILGLVAIIISIIVFYMQRRKKSLAYEIIANTSLLTLNDEIKGKVQILFEGSVVQNVYLILLHILNDGNTAIVSSDYEFPLTFEFGETSQILSAEVVKTSPNKLEPQFTLRKNSVEFTPLLLNSGDSIVFKLLLAQYEGELSVRARIMGVAEVKQVSISVDRLRRNGGWSLLAGIILVFSVKITGAVGAIAGIILILAGFWLAGMADDRQKRNQLYKQAKN
jgi:hypothetical protein